MTQLPSNPDATSADIFYLFIKKISNLNVNTQTFSLFKCIVNYKKRSFAPYPSLSSKEETDFKDSVSKKIHLKTLNTEFDELSYLNYNMFKWFKEYFTPIETIKVSEIDKMDVNLSVKNFYKKFDNKLHGYNSLSHSCIACSDYKNKSWLLDPIVFNTWKELIRTNNIDTKIKIIKGQASPLLPEFVDTALDEAGESPEKKLLLDDLLELKGIKLFTLFKEFLTFVIA
jgi:hypothetical protein